MRIAIAVGIAAAIAAAVAVAYYSAQPSSAPPAAVYSAGDFTVTVLEDSASRFLAKLENNGSALSSAAAFAVKKGLNNNCEAQGIVVSNFKVVNDGGRAMPVPDSIPAGSVTIDSAGANIPGVPTGENFETAVYVLRLQPGSIFASELVQKIPIHTLDAGEQELFEECLQRAGMGYPLLIKVANPRLGSQTYFTLSDAAGNRYESALFIDENALKTGELYWPPSKEGWLSGNFTMQSGPAPTWREAPEITLGVRTVSADGIQEFSDTVSLDLQTAELDFVEVAKGSPVPAYPKFWEIQVDIESMEIR